MIDRTPFLNHLGRRVAHVTAASNVPGICKYGLLSASDLARATGHSNIALRNERLRLQAHGLDATLNHQKPVLHGLAAANRIVEGHTAQSWAKQLDQRIFFWPEKHGAKFAKSIAADVPIAVLWLDTDQLTKTFEHNLFLSPINSGNFRQGGANAARGDWLYVPITAGLGAFRTNRVRRGLVKGKDGATEISLTVPVPASTLDALLLGIDEP